MEKGISLVTSTKLHQNMSTRTQYLKNILHKIWLQSKNNAFMVNVPVTSSKSMGTKQGG